MSKYRNELEAKTVEGLLSKMSMEQKVGQCFTYLWSGHLISPSVVEAIEKLYAGGLRLQPAFQSGVRHVYYSFDTAGKGYNYPKGYKTISETLLSPGILGNIDPVPYAERLNKLQKIAVQRNGVPLHMAVDQEGDFSRNYMFGKVNYFPSAMGQTASGDPSFVYKVNYTLAKQLSTIGMNAIHSPVLDVNNNPKNPEIGIRSYGDTPEVAAKYGAAALKGLQDGGMMTFSKHFPGRGDSSSDAHFSTPVLNVSRERLFGLELVPFIQAIKNGTDGIMIAHNIYTALEPGVIATVSKRILTDLLRYELGFDGVITTDAIAMQALMKVYPLPEACARALQAGADLVLNKTESKYRDQGFLETIRFVKEGLITERELEDKARRIITMKYRRGLIKAKGQVNASKAAYVINSPATKKLAFEAARRAAIVVRNKQGLLPLSPKKRLLVVDQRMEDVYYGMDLHNHRLKFTEAMFGYSLNIVAADVNFKANERDSKLILSLAKDKAIDIVVMVNDYARGEENNSDIVKKLIKMGKKVIVVTNTPYAMAIPKEVKTAVCTFSSTPESQVVAAGILFGKIKPAGKWPLKKTKK
ncbi:MAG: hypothetical protein A2044_05510 [Candidatus Firestonebacteria bacterium GWA2_43_8]|nr:MAG: hypothetical protein A2044_05510 [Candidatus Firestonebacteria bacterium GWA2_43_8]